MGIAENSLKSIKFDLWTAKELKTMKMGGNSALLEFFSGYGITRNTDIGFKYRTKAAEYYLNYLAALADGHPLDSEQPELEAGLTISALIDPAFAQETGKKKNSALGSLSGLFKKAVSTTKTAGSNFLTRLNSNETFQRVENKTAVVFSSIGEKIKRGKGKITESATYQVIKTRSSQVVHSISQSVALKYQKLMKKTEPEETQIIEQ